MTVDTEEVRFVATASRGEVSGLLRRGTAVRALLVLAHGAGANMRHDFMEAITDALAQHEVATLRFNFPYMEAGRRRPDPQPILLATVRSATAVARAYAGGVPLFAGGKSMGGRMTSLAAAARPLPEVRGLVFLGFPLHPAGKPGTARADHLDAFALPLLFVQGTRDKLADLGLLGPVIRPLGARAQLHVVEGGDHSLGLLVRAGRSKADVMEEVAGAIAAWITSNSAPGARGTI